MILKYLLDVIQLNRSVLPGQDEVDLVAQGYDRGLHPVYSARKPLIEKIRLLIALLVWSQKDSVYLFY